MAFKILIEKEPIGGSLVYQAEAKDRAAAKLEKKLNELPVEDVYSVTPSQDDSEFQLIAVIKLADKEVEEADEKNHGKKTKGAK